MIAPVKRAMPLARTAPNDFFGGPEATAGVLPGVFAETAGAVFEGAGAPGDAFGAAGGFFAEVAGAGGAFAEVGTGFGEAAIDLDGLLRGYKSLLATTQIAETVAQIVEATRQSGKESVGTGFG